MTDNILYTCIKDIKAISKRINIKGIIISIFQSKTKAGNIYCLVISDESGYIKCTLFDNRASLLKEGDIIIITNVYAKEYQEQLTIYKGNGGDLWRTGNFSMVFNDKNNMSRKIYRNEKTGEKSFQTVKYFRNQNDKTRKTNNYVWSKNDHKNHDSNENDFKKKSVHVDQYANANSSNGSVNNLCQNDGDSNRINTENELNKKMDLLKHQNVSLLKNCCQIINYHN